MGEIQLSGTFRVELTPQAPVEGVGDLHLNRAAIRKTFHGDIEGISRGEMLAHRSGVDGSAGYVALEWVEATLAGRSGGFALQHFGQMDRGTPSLTVAVVPDSATGELAGLAGTMRIIIEGGEHRYEMTATLDAPGSADA